MKDQVFMSPNNGALCVGVPLFRHIEADELDATHGYSIKLEVIQAEPLAYVLDIGETATIVAAEWAHEKLIQLGDL